MSLPSTPLVSDCLWQVPWCLIHCQHKSPSQLLLKLKETPGMQPYCQLHLYHFPKRQSTIVGISMGQRTRVTVGNKYHNFFTCWQIFLQWCIGIRIVYHLLNEPNGFCSAASQGTWNHVKSLECKSNNSSRKPTCTWKLKRLFHGVYTTKIKSLIKTVQQYW